ncbi:MAG: FAD-dependent oxidoreductase [Spirochaetales bacterium]|uniref:FAD-dependent oxidoreductase n=1 Tax=Candidatus Thalassospirochaeta sargassi TaxID=3119039 RepID=A0AAJ1IDL4_9SPIO|nr:FAD-dependent oxidoreductase [Spirochaetales bacterium]
MKRVVIIGGGVAGKKLAESLYKNKTAEVFLVEPKEYFEVPYAMLRALVEPEEFSPTIREKYSSLIPGVKHIMKKAVGIEADKILLDDSTELEYDYLVIASGSSFINWPYLKSNETKIDSRQAEVENDGAKLEKAGSILIIGGGPVGVELAGEIAYKWSDKKVTIINSGSRILSGLSEKMTVRTEKLLKDMGVEIFNSTRLKENGDGTWIDENSKVFTADVVYPAVGMSLNTAWLEGSNIERTEKGAVKVEADLRVKGADNIFAIGDVNDVPEIKLGALAGIQADFTAENIKRLVNNPEAVLKAYKPAKPMSFIPVGKKAGAVQLPFGHPHFMISMKQKDLFVSKSLNR